jgi:Protein phosphatase 2C
MTSTGSPVWKAVAASRTGATHIAAAAANQDAYATLRVGDVTAVAVADGHGHPSHFRSAQGARLAVDLAVALTVDAATAADSPQALQERLLEDVTRQLLHDWRQRVLEHAESVPFSADGTDTLIGSGEDAILRTYGTTLIALVGTPAAVGFAQIGDGDAVAVLADGDVIRPLPQDPKLDGIHTTSLSQRHAADSMRIAVIDTHERQLLVAFATTDGFSAPQLDGLGWWRQVGGELATHLQTRGSGWIAEKLAGWLAEPAETGGDDTTMGMLLNLSHEPLDDSHGSPEQADVPGTNKTF